MAAPRKISDANYQRLLAVALARRQLHQLPTDAQLAAECGCTVRGVRDAMHRLLLSVTTVSGEIDFGNIRAYSPRQGASSESPLDLQAPGVRRGRGGGAQGDR